MIDPDIDRAVIRRVRPTRPGNTACAPVSGPRNGGSSTRLCDRRAGLKARSAGESRASLAQAMVPAQGRSELMAAKDKEGGELAFATIRVNGRTARKPKLPTPVGGRICKKNARLNGPEGKPTECTGRPSNASTGSKRDPHRLRSVTWCSGLVPWTWISEQEFRAVPTRLGGYWGDIEKPYFLIQISYLSYLYGAAEGTRTPDPIITNDVLYHLSYSGDGVSFT